MLLSIIVSYLPYSLVTAFTPGPNNIVALYAISQKGWQQGKNILLGIAAGFLCVMVLCGLFCYQLATYLPAVANILKYVGAAYIVYLAIHVARSKPEDTAQKEMSFLSGFLLEFVNVKIILYAITIFTGYVLPHGITLPILLFHAVLITCIGLAGTLTWSIAGGMFQRFLQKYYLPFDLAMAAILLWCAGALVVGK